MENRGKRASAVGQTETRSRFHLPCPLSGATMTAGGCVAIGGVSLEAPKRVKPGPRRRAGSEAEASMGERAGGPRVAALIGPYLSGKTTLLESLLFAAEAIPRRGSQKDKNTVGDATPEARARQMSTELNAAHATYLGDPWFLLDCPGSVE